MSARPPSDRPQGPSDPPPGTVEAWCLELVRTETLARKLALPPAGLAWEERPPARRLARPGRPPELRVTARAPRAPRPGALSRPEARARLLHTFLHHELQAAELFAWALLAFPDTPPAFRAGLFALCREELEHLALYAERLAALGGSIGEHPVRDWFWQRVAAAPDAAGFVALQGLGLEGANLEHSARYAALFRAAGDEASARVLEQVEREEVAHVAFAARWFERLTGAPLEYDAWRARLPAPLTPAVLRGLPLNRPARLRAGMDEAFLDRLDAEPPATGGAR